MSLSQGSNFFLERQLIGERLLNDTHVCDSHIEEIREYLAIPYRNHNATKFTRIRLQGYSRALQCDLALIRTPRQNQMDNFVICPSVFISDENCHAPKPSLQAQPDGMQVLNGEVRQRGVYHGPVSPEAKANAQNFMLEANNPSDDAISIIPQGRTLVAVGNYGTKMLNCSRISVPLVGTIPSQADIITPSLTAEICECSVFVKAVGPNSEFPSTNSATVAERRYCDGIQLLSNHATGYNCPTKPSTDHRNLKAGSIICRPKREDHEYYQGRDSSKCRLNDILARYREKTTAKRDHTDFWEERNSKPGPNSKLPSYRGEYDYCLAIEGEMRDPSLTLEFVEGIKEKWKFSRNRVRDDCRMWRAAEGTVSQASKYLAQKRELVDAIRKIEDVEKWRLGLNPEAAPCEWLFEPLTAIPLRMLWVPQ
ncbi:uncharacterized protein BP5553_04480 [Venustampulla echinocandica]|uniref:Uncharacterized protein n=1 Tax=Venustampulla echinocandica TaxID=2656787 RepID=A0A370TNF5_9HELO|nr:uncharacterized protein BP5553_04480 [Venustampulla echinocandica]RDL37047.1 hypothetical protein BP5553_04480 [Venustampulla echinocandica]